jgi:predicted CoA-binding protein
MNPRDALHSAHTILVIDWPTKEVPESLTLAGFHVVVHGGPGPEDYSVYELNNGNVVPRHLGRPPERADLVYSHRPLSELPQIIATAKNLHAKTIWTQSGLSAAGVNDPQGCWIAQEQMQSAQNLVQSAGLNYITQPFIGDVAREIQALRIRH